MAEIISNGSNTKKLQRIIKIDLTPMVDLGFLLITFFVFTTTMTQSTAMKIVVPDDRDSTACDPVCASCSITILAGKNNQLFYYEGLDKEPAYHSISYAAEGLRKILVVKKQQLINLFNKDRLVMIIKPSAGANFKNLIDIIDEASICDVKKYYIADLDESDKLKVE